MELTLTKQGCLISKKKISEKELKKIKKELTVSPIVYGDFNNNNVSFKIYKENKNLLVIPRFYAKTFFGNNFSIKYNIGTTINFNCNIILRDYQKPAVDKVLAILKKDSGTILSVPCAFGKTIVAVYMIAQLKKKTLVVVHNDFLMSQWIERIEGISDAKIGIIKGTKFDIEGKDIVIAMLQSLSMKKFENDTFDSFGMVIFDECHHLGAKVFCQALFKLNSTYMLGLSATPDRKDGLTKIFKYFLGDIGYCVKQKYNFAIKVQAHTLFFDNEYYKDVFNVKGLRNIPAMINNLVLCKERTDYILNLIHPLMEDGRKILILTDRREHAVELNDYLKDKYEVGYVIGGMKEADRNESLQKDIIIGTYQMVSEGFDVDKLDTLIFATPKVSIEQAVGRILRKQTYEKDPLVIDIIDKITTFKNQSYTRKRFYKKNNYEITNFSNEKKEVQKEVNKFSYGFSD